MMRIGVDARELGGRPTGVGRYLRELLLHWESTPAFAGSVLVLFTPDSEVARTWRPHGNDGATLVWQYLPGRGRTLWEQHQLARAASQARLDVFFAPAYTAPLRLGPPSVVVMHDVSFAAHPEWFPWRHGLRLRQFARWSTQRAASVITMSAFSAAEIRTHYDVPPDRIRVIPLAADYHDALPAAASGHGQAPPASTVLYVGSIFERRHVPLLMRGVARARVHVPDVRLVVIGENRMAGPDDLRTLAVDLGIAEALELHDYVTDEALATAYASAGVFAFLSSYEGFGLTPLEAMRHHVPVIVMDTPVAREVYGDGAWYVDAGDAEAVGKALVALLTQTETRAAAIAAGDATVARYRWETTARATWQVLRDVVEGRAT